MIAAGSDHRSARTTHVEPDVTILTTQVARMYFDRQMSKVEIAGRLGISRFRVARLLDQALAQGIVRIEFRDAAPEARALARTIEERWGIDLCVVASGQGGLGTEVSVPRIAAGVIADLLGPGDTIGIAWGSTLAAVAREMPARSDPSLTVVQLAGGSARFGRDQNPAAVARGLADRLGAAHHALPAPAFVGSPALRDALCREPEVRDTIAAFATIDVAVIGIGALDGSEPGWASSLVRSGVLDARDIAAIEAAGGVGDLVLYPFDADGHFVAPELLRRAIGISIEQLRAVPRMIAVAGGANKASAIDGALRTGLIHVLVTDEAAAERLAAARPTH